MVCAPDQSVWTNVTEVQRAYSNNATVVKEVDVFVEESFGQTLYDSCKVSRHLQCEGLQGTAWGAEGYIRCTALQLLFPLNDRIEWCFLADFAALGHCVHVYR